MDHEDDRIGRRRSGRGNRADADPAQAQRHGWNDGRGWDRGWDRGRGHDRRNWNRGWRGDRGWNRGGWNRGYDRGWRGNRVRCVWVDGWYGPERRCYRR